MSLLSTFLPTWTYLDDAVRLLLVLARDEAMGEAGVEGLDRVARHQPAHHASHTHYPQTQLPILSRRATHVDEENIEATA